MVISYRRRGTTYQSYLKRSSWIFWHVKMGPMVYPETLVRNYHCTLLNNPEDIRSQAHISSYNQEILWFLWNSKFYCRIKFLKHQQIRHVSNCNCILVLTTLKVATWVTETCLWLMRQIHPFHAFQFCFLLSIWILSFYLHLILASVHFFQI